MRNGVLISVIVLLFTTGFYCCSKDDGVTARKIEGVISLNLHVKHHSWGVPHVDVYLKKNVSEWPGTDTAKYDFQTQTDQYGDCRFSSLFPGKYFIYVTGYDPIFRDSIIGYTPLVMNETNIVNNNVEYTIVVSE